ncbi:hypothetical protein NDU88_004092 [Pleurodeles waltl]|uniref:Uncharacterized protein n=1 Tax=Pleurodeles waltl TaxID=8319 RepID=A0AAV7MTK8_PLEWA|nr:hypothetical protein NDU88_004092 [Pleurodeles waltl]
MPRGRAATPALCCFVPFTIVCRPQHFQGPRSRSRAAPLRRPMWRIFTWAPGPPPSPPLQRGDSSGVPRCFWADRPRAASARGSTRGRNHNRGPAPTLSGGRPHSGAVPLLRPTGRIFTWALGPPPAPPLQRGDSSGVPRCFQAVRPQAASARGFSRLSRPPALVLAAGPGPPVSTLLGRHGGPITAGVSRQYNTSAQTPIGPETVRFFAFSRRPLRSEKIRRAPSLVPWPRPDISGELWLNRDYPFLT